MRIRKKPWAESEMTTNDRLIQDPKTYKGRWREWFGNDNPLHIEIGCGKGRFITTMAAGNRWVNYIGVERQTHVLVTALRKARSVDGGSLGFIREDVKNLSEYFAPGDVSRIYINFCDPWQDRKKWAKRRLTHHNFLNLYQTFFKGRGEIFFKTDNRSLFEFSRNEFTGLGWCLKNISLDLHNSGWEGNVMTEYEEKFAEKGLPIYRLEANFSI